MRLARDRAGVDAARVGSPDASGCRLIVGEFSREQISSKLEQTGLRLRLGPVVSEIRSRFPAIRHSVLLHYRAHEVVDDDEFADFRVSVEPSRGVRRFVKPKAIFRFEGNRPFQPLPANQAFALLEWGLNWAITAHCQHWLTVHSAVVERNGRALLLPAPPGSGKSTLCAALVARGWRLLSDELAVIDLDRRVIVPLPRPISLKNRSIDVIRAFWPEARIGAVIRDTGKGDVAHVQPPTRDVGQSAVMATPGWIVIPRYVEGERYRLTEIGKGAAMMRLVDNAFNYSTHGRRGFDALADVVERSRCFEFAYGGDLQTAVDTFDELARQ
jgi:HprK-related kinase A